MARIAETLPAPHRLTVSDYYRMAEAGILREDQRVELIDGAIIDMSPIGSRHAATVARINRLMVWSLGAQATVSPQNPLRLSDYSEPEPDIALLRPRQDEYAASHPGPMDVVLLIEVADSSLRFDREVKLPLYARHGIPEVWLVDLEQDRVLVFREPGADGYREFAEHGPGAILEPTQLAGLGVPVSEILPPA